MYDKRLYLWSKKVKKRDGVCKACISKYNLEAHHIYPKSKYPSKKYDLKNGVTLCRDCHREGFLSYHQIFGYSGNYIKFYAWLFFRRVYIFIIFVVIPITLIILFLTF